MKFLVIAIIAIALGFGATYFSFSGKTAELATVNPVPVIPTETVPETMPAPEPPVSDSGLPPQNGAIDNAQVQVLFSGNTTDKRFQGSFNSILANFKLITGTLVGGVTLDTASITTTDEGVTALLKGTSFLNVAKFPTAMFSVVSWKKAADGTFTVSGKITVRGITKTMSFPVLYENKAYRADIPLSLTDYGIKNSPLIGSNVTLQIIVPVE